MARGLMSISFSSFTFSAPMVWTSPTPVQYPEWHRDIRYLSFGDIHAAGEANIHVAYHTKASPDFLRELTGYVPDAIIKLRGYRDMRRANGEFRLLGALVCYHRQFDLDAWYEYGETLPFYPRDKEANRYRKWCYCVSAEYVEYMKTQDSCRLP
jgi:hypothetical protein